MIHLIERGYILVGFVECEEVSRCSNESDGGMIEFEEVESLEIREGKHFGLVEVEERASGKKCQIWHRGEDHSDARFQQKQKQMKTNIVLISRNHMDRKKEK